MKDIIEDEVFTMFPDFVRAVVVAKELRIGEYNHRIEALLKGTQTTVQKSGEQLKEHQRITSWDIAHRKFGSNPNRFPPSIRSLLERVLRGKSLPYINDAVATFNYVSLKFLVPSGGDNLDGIVGDVHLGPAKGHERFTPLGGRGVEHPEVNEVIYYDDDSKVMCRRWNWRNGEETKITTGTSRMVINVDGLGGDAKPVVQEAAYEIAKLLNSECGGEVHCDLLHEGHRRTDI